MAQKYLRVISKYPAYALMQDQRGFVSQKFGGENNHTGYDTVGNMMDNPVCAIIDGEVTDAYYSGALGWIAIYQSESVKIAYYHLKKLSVKAGDKVEAGKTRIGIEGGTGTLAKGQKHLHISVWIGGMLVDPEPYLDGAKKFPVSEGDEDMIEIRKVIKPLNLRSSRSLANDSNIVYKDMPNGTVFQVVEKIKEGNTTWGKVYVTIGGKSYAGWSNIASTWSKVV